MATVTVRHPDGHDLVVSGDYEVITRYADNMARAWNTAWNSTEVRLETCIDCEVVFVYDEDSGYQHQPIEVLDLANLDETPVGVFAPEGVIVYKATDDGTREGDWYNEEDDFLFVFLCSWCRESDDERMSTVVRFSPDGSIQAQKFGDHVRYIEDEGELVDVGEWEWFSEHFGARTWHSTDAWRGYFETTHAGLVKFTEGWVTGYPDDTVSHKLTASDLYQQLHAGDLVPAVPVYWLFEPTSNVFSTASEILVADGDLDAFKQWLREVEVDPEALDAAFN